LHNTRVVPRVLEYSRHAAACGMDRNTYRNGSTPIKKAMRDE
jgi:hypothetical protein